MALSVLLGESDLRVMPPELRERLLTWYFNRPVQTLIDPQPQAETLNKEIPSVVGDPNVDSRRITFPELVKAGLLRPGEVLRCRPLKRQKRSGLEKFIGGATVGNDGSVIFGDEKYAVPSKLAKAMLNANGGNAVATNGYDYLFVETPKGFVRLAELRQKAIGADPAEEAEVQTLMEETEAFGSRQEALAWVRENNSKK